KLAGVSRGIDLAAVEGAAQAPLAVPVVVATGQPPDPGADARIQVVAPQLRDRSNEKATRDASVDAPADGQRTDRVEFREWFRNPSVHVGAVLAIKTPLVPAQPGHTVWGGVRFAPEPRDIDIRATAGVGTKVDDNGVTLRATTVGMPTWLGRRITV